MNKKMISMAISMLVIISLALTACGGTPTTTEPPTTKPPTTVPPTTVPPTTAPPVTLTMWHNWGPDDSKYTAFKSILDDFRAANPDINLVDEVYVDADIPIKLETAATANQEPELVLSGGLGNAFNWVESGVVVAVNDYITEWGLADSLLPSAITQYTATDGSVIAFPLEGFTWPVWYNTKVLESVGLGIPTTTDELIAAAKALRAAGKPGPLVASGADNMGGKLFELIIQSAMTDAEAIAAIGGGDWTVPNAIKGVETFVALRDAGVFVDGVEGIDYGGAEALFGTGTVAMCHYGAWAFADPAMEPVVADVTLGGFPLPAGSPHQLPVYFAAFSAKGIFITPNGQAKIDAVEKLIKFIFQPEMIARLVESAGMSPSIKNVPVDESKLNPLFAQTLTMNAEVVFISDAYKPGAVWPDFDRVTQEAFAPGVTAEQILAKMTAAYAALK
jgi:multiple sugar transport system substrate-binding protein